MKKQSRRVRSKYKNKNTQWITIGCFDADNESLFGNNKIETSKEKYVQIKTKTAKNWQEKRPLDVCKYYISKRLEEYW